MRYVIKCYVYTAEENTAWLSATIPTLSLKGKGEGGANQTRAVTNIRLMSQPTDGKESIARDRVKNGLIK